MGRQASLASAGVIPCPRVLKHDVTRIRVSPSPTGQ